MYQIVRRIEFSYGHRLIDHPGKCLHLHGHNGRAEVILDAERLDHRGMIVDFSDLGRKVKGWIDEHLDHRMILRSDDPLVAVLESAGEPLYLMEGNPTAEEIARLLFEAVRELGFPVAEVRLWETENSMAIYARPS